MGKKKSLYFEPLNIPEDLLLYHFIGHSLYLYGDSLLYLLESLGYSTEISKVIINVKQRTALIELDNYLDGSDLILELSAISIPIKNKYSIAMVKILKAVCENRGRDFDCKNIILRLIELYPKKKSLIELLGINPGNETVSKEYYLPSNPLPVHRLNFFQQPNFPVSSISLLEWELFY